MNVEVVTASKSNKNILLVEDINNSE